MANRFRTRFHVQQPVPHGATAATHDALTRALWSFEQAAKGIAIIKRLGRRVIMNTVSAKYLVLGREILVAEQEFVVHMTIDQCQYLLCLHHALHLVLLPTFRH